MHGRELCAAWHVGHKHGWSPILAYERRTAGRMGRGDRPEGGNVGAMRVRVVPRRGGKGGASKSRSMVPMYCVREV